MADEGKDKGKLLVSIPPIHSEVVKYRSLKVIMPFIFIATFAYIGYLAWEEYGLNVPWEFIPVVIFVAAIYIVLTLFAMTVYIRYAYPVNIYGNGIELKTTRLGERFGRAGFIARSEMESIEVYKLGKMNENLGFSVQCKNGKTAWIGERAADDLKPVIAILKQNFGGLVKERGSLTKK